MYTQEHVDKLEREIQKGNLLLIKVQAKWQQAQMAAGGGGYSSQFFSSSSSPPPSSSTAGGVGGGGGGGGVGGGGGMGGATPRPDWEEAQGRLPQLQVRAAQGLPVLCAPAAAVQLNRPPADAAQPAHFTSGDM